MSLTKDSLLQDIAGLLVLVSMIVAVGVWV
jgi:hypothetical protein